MSGQITLKGDQGSCVGLMTGHKVNMVTRSGLWVGKARGYEDTYSRQGCCVGQRTGYWELNVTRCR